MASIGQGSFASVYQATSRLTGTVRAVKRVVYLDALRALKRHDHGSDDPVIREVRLLRSLQHVCTVAIWHRSHADIYIYLYIYASWQSNIIKFLGASPMFGNTEADTTIGVS